MTSDTPLAGKRKLLTGGTTGIGRATLAMPVAEGARVLTFGRHRGPLDEAVAGHAGVETLVADAATATASTPFSPRSRIGWAA